MQQMHRAHPDTDWKKLMRIPEKCGRTMSANYERNYHSVEMAAFLIIR